MAFSGFLIVGLGGAIGAMLRHGVGVGASRILGVSFPYGTLIVNVLGSLLMGVLIAWLAKRTGGTSNELRLFLATGVLGGFTTFSAFSLDAMALYERGEVEQALFYVLTSVLVSIVALGIGLWATRALA